MPFEHPDDLLPPDPDLPELHQRDYRIRVFDVDDSHMLVRGAVRDLKPEGLYIADDPQPMAVHHMVVDMTVEVPSMVITDLVAAFEMHPHESCPSIASAYSSLVGTSVARGYINRVREAFGGPRGCTHTTALLVAMGPVVHQSTFSKRMRMMRLREREGGQAAFSEEDRQRSVAMNLNTCHVWEDGGEWAEQVRSGTARDLPVFITRRLKELGRDADQWRSPLRG